MKIDAQSSQAELQDLLRRSLRRELLAASPLNLRPFLRYAVLFLLFPAMLFGFKAGLLLTGCFAAFLLTLLLCGQEGLASCSVYLWLALGLGVLFYVNLQLWRNAWRESRLRRQYRAAGQGLSHAKTAPLREPLKWQPVADGFCEANLVLQAPQRAIYALLLSLPAYQGGRLLALGTQGCCVLPAQGKKGEAFQVLMLYSLEPGRHELRWRLEGAAQKAEISQLNRVAAAD